MIKTYLIGRLLKDTKMTQVLERINAEAVRVGFPYIFEGHPVRPEMMEYLNALRASMPKVKFLPIRKTTNLWCDNHVEVYHEFVVYLEENPLGLGRVGYQKHVRTSEDMFTVASRKIANGKYGVHKDEYNMVTSKDIKTAVRNARKYLIPMSHVEIASELKGDVDSKLQGVRQDPVRKMENLVDQISRMRRLDLMKEIRSLAQQGVQFISQEFQEAANQANELLDTYAEENRRNIELVFVRVRMVGDEQYVDITNNVWAGGPKHVTTYKGDDLTDDLSGSIAVLSILEDGQYVPRVGQKVDSNMYWIERG